ncbi:isocitrate lyase/phosphoenolpyruvate mutase family protein [Streptomyces sp. NA02950]|uniref:isocitrate lyase/phosphoenolpyruvate mutase family protein n=1 Tax=Streptomyces sp. NA02950 TaxID=2742137 RepID=UPI0020CB34E1|nr:isocitrate lyase/phosphoenolpyruvate mutase family protein [Streptomyces sp. NA02950]
MCYGKELREAIGSPRTTPLIGIYDMYSASIAAEHYNELAVSGFGFAASHYGLPDIGFIAWPDLLGFAERLRLAFPEHHLLVDIDDGYVDPEVACHVVQRLERAGASGVILEDRKRPRRCGHADGKLVLPLEEYLAKLSSTRTAAYRSPPIWASSSAEMYTEALRSGPIRAGSGRSNTSCAATATDRTCRGRRRWRGSDRARRHRAARRNTHPACRTARTPPGQPAGSAGTTPASGADAAATVAVVTPAAAEPASRSRRAAIQT